MERSFDFEQHKPKVSTPADAPVQLLNQHLLIKADLADELIGSGRQVFAVYYHQKQMLLIAPDTDQEFKKLHKAILLFVKIKNVAGDRSISMQEFFADWPDLDAGDRILNHEFQSGINVLKVTI